VGIQTFLPCSGFTDSARVLDARRLDKQRVQTIQVLRALTVHQSHRSALVRKDPGHYRPLFPDVPDDLPYVWPASERPRRVPLT
jgi:hypothetical protein